MSSFAPSTANRIAAIASRTASDADGEALVAARLLVRELGRAATTIGEVVLKGLQPDHAVAPAGITAAHQGLAFEALRRADLFEPHELEFLETMSRTFIATERRRHWLESLVSRVRQQPPRRAGAA